MHGVAPQMCGQAARLLLGGGAGGRSLGFLLTGARVAYRVEDDQLGTGNCRLGANCIRLAGNGCRWHHDLLFSDSAPA
jgi:hypothetical protein